MNLDLIPRSRLKMIPSEQRARHEYCFFAHDECVRLLKEYEAAGAHLITVNFKSKLTADEFNRIAATNPIEALQATGYPQEAKRVVLNQITIAMASDCLHHIFEALKCLEKRKFIVALNLLRKPLKDSLLYLSWILGNEDDFYTTFMTGNPEQLSIKRLSSSRKTILYNAAQQTGLGPSIDVDLLHELLYDRKSPRGFERLFQHAVHLITIERIELRTSPQNFNFIFKSPADNDVYLIYEWLPYILMFLANVILQLFDRIKPMDAGGRDAMRLRTMYGYALVANLEGDTVESFFQRILGPHLKCEKCGSPLKVTRRNAVKIVITDSFQCTRCRAINPFPFSWLI